MRLFLVPCMLMLGAVPTCQAADPASVREQLMEADRKFAAAAKAKGLDGWMEWMADDAVRLPKLGGKAIAGKEAVRKSDAQLFADPKRQLRWEPTEAGAFEGGNLGFTTGSYRVVKTTDSGEEVVGRGAYLTWWRKEAGGSWRVILDTGTPEPPEQK